ncbi:hypothetical protein BH09MYX1_BH09MYX1_50120 [soil metagenome]
MTRTLTEVPDTVIDESSRAIRYGSYRGAFPRVDLSSISGPLSSRFRRKRWVYVIVVREPYVVTFATVHLGYLANAFIHVYDTRSRKFVVERTVVRTPLALRFGDLADHRYARFISKPLAITVRRPSSSVTEPMLASVKTLDFTLDASLDPHAVPPSITAVARIPGGVVNVTEKRGPFALTGTMRVGTETIDLAGGIAGYDTTECLLARDTRWRWAFALGKDASSGEPFALNLVEGFVGEAECAAFAFGKTHPLAEGRIVYERDRPMGPWKITNADGAVDLRFEPGAALTEKRDFGVVSARLLQPTGKYFGTVRLPERAIEIDGAYGVAEDQALKW